MSEPDEGFTSADWDEYFESESKREQSDQRFREMCDEDPLLDILANGVDE